MSSLAAPQSLSEPSLETMPGLWHRSLLAWPDGRRDTTSFVNWLQGPGLYLDLRQPEGRPDFTGQNSLSALTPETMMWLAAQEGFAGELVEEDGWFEWRRDIDFQPKAIYSDIGRLWIEGDVMVEEGKDIPYIEHWHREPIGSMPLWAARLEDRETGQKGAIARMGSLFMIARERYCAVPEGLTLAECVAGAADMARAQEFLDCEISQGAVTSTGWFVQRSSLPFREGKSLAPARTGDLFEMQDQDRGGKPFTRRWEITDLRGEPLLDVLMNGVAT
ncbi:MAG: hypothetical protein CMI62_10920 [Parvibaculum sp.]|jgi:hypothetical protein|uniref:hypothetical protein n=1 Tax=Parvibaculum sp. TaxID=2024848 RepID=UPI000C6A264B|nr:hypothetical protein [Parvibaculum sp.]MAU61224.1 hypothetical protein [Parvibaculum sp.]|tara:strand:- start:47696 stop:48523 length:828 start_codon:yes stop_codon:yes gene_type:complete